MAEITQRIANYSSSHHYQSSAALFHDQEEYQEFVERHQKDSVPTDAPLGEDQGSLRGHRRRLHHREGRGHRLPGGDSSTPGIQPNSGNPVPLVRDFLTDLYEKYPRHPDPLPPPATGYGEEIIKNAFGLDMGVVETVAHFTAAKKFDARGGLHHRHRRPGHQVL